MAISAKCYVYPCAKKILSAAQAKAIGMTAEEMLAELIESQTMPFQTGNLQNTVTRPDKAAQSKGQVKIVHEGPYARKLYYHPEYNFDKTYNPNAGGLWWEPWLNGDKKKRPVQLYRRFYRQLTGGLVK